VSIRPLPSIPRSGIELARRIASRVALLVLACALCACPYGFAGGGLPSDIHTVAIIPFDNDTPAAGLQRDIFDALRTDMRRRLGLGEAAEARADAVVRGRITRYDADIPTAYSSDPRQATTARRRLQLTADVEIVAQKSGKTLWARKGIVVEGEYAEQSEASGRREAVQKLVDQVITGAQSQW
jgi:hypothetical protein